MPTLYFSSDLPNYGTVANPKGKRYQTEGLLKGNAQFSAYPEVNCQAMRSTCPVNETVKVEDHKEIQKQNEDSSSTAYLLR